MGVSVCMSVSLALFVRVRVCALFGQVRAAKVRVCVCAFHCFFSLSPLSLSLALFLYLCASLFVSVVCLSACLSLSPPPLPTLHDTCREHRTRATAAAFAIATHKCNILQHSTATIYCNTHCKNIQQHTTATRQCNIQPHTTATVYCNTPLQQHTATHN